VDVKDAMMTRAATVVETNRDNNRKDDETLGLEDANRQITRIQRR